MGKKVNHENALKSDEPDKKKSKQTAAKSKQTAAKGRKRIHVMSSSSESSENEEEESMEVADPEPVEGTRTRVQRF